MAKSLENQPWDKCYYCPMTSFKTSSDFVKHLRERHCTKEGGSYVCRYGFNGVCPSLPLDGVNDRDYETHVSKYHVNQMHQREPEWSIFSAAQNLPAVLNDPSRGKQLNLFTKKWGDSFIDKTHIALSLHLPQVNWTDFDSYLKRTGKRYNRHIRIENDGLKQPDIATSPIRQQISQTTTATSHNNHHLINKNSTTDPELINNYNPCTISNITTGNLNDIPSIFMKSTLDLNNPETFSIVYPGIVGESTTTTSSSASSLTKYDEKSKQSGRLLQEKLSYYLDIVEVQIAKQVSQKSSAFFHAMTSQDAIMSEMNSAIKKVKDLREKILKIDEINVKNSLKIILLARTRENYLQTLDKLKLMATVQQTQPMIQLLLRTQDYVAALDLIGTTQEICSQELIGVHCFRHLPMQLKEMEKLIDKMLSTEFERYATIDLNRPLTAATTSANTTTDDPNELNSSTTTSTNSSSNNINENIIEDDKLVSIIMGLLREKNFTFIDTYKEETIVAIKAIIKQMVIEIILQTSHDDDNDELCLTGAGEEAQSNLTIPEWIELLERATITLMKLLKRCKRVHQVILQTADASAGKLLLTSGTVTENLSFIDSDITFLTDNDYQIVIDKLNDLMFSICNYCHERCANLVSSQSLEKSVATASELERLQHIVNEFSNGSESISGVQSIPLKTALNIQVTRFVNKFHSERKSKMALLLDLERWKQVDIPNEFQKIIDRISNNDYNSIQQKQHENHQNNNSNNNSSSSNSNNNNNNDDNNKLLNDICKQHQTLSSSSITSPVLLVDGKPFSLVGAALILVQIVTEYCKCAEQLPICSNYLSRNVIDLLRTFNSRSCQLILGAGALHTAGLKTITSSNLALVSRALQLVLWLLPKVKLHFHKIQDSTAAAATVSTTSVSGYDIVEKDYISHIKEIENKVLSIVTNLVYNQLQAWDARPPVPSQSFRNISRHFIKLHEAIATILPEIQIHQIYRIVHRNFKDKLREQLLKYNIVNNGGPQHGTVISELTFYMETLRTLKALPIDELDDDKTLEDIWIK